MMIKFFNTISILFLVLGLTALCFSPVFINDPEVLEADVKSEMVIKLGKGRFKLYLNEDCIKNFDDKKKLFELRNLTSNTVSETVDFSYSSEIVKYKTKSYQCSGYFYNQEQGIYRMVSFSTSCDKILLIPFSPDVNIMPIFSVIIGLVFLVLSLLFFLLKVLYKNE
ncbi:hypothetical protein [Chryseobacterium sp.]|uniref:hypothetical protein n=1 Tax=Chryseobacterium sp. TaxID=1871047 RepID=UPI0011C96175|nr:hypothetical protein [Chryseobacterium sp.]TXF77709.1 hypothetical protein FUA25_07240 [Chryseobacterium sp.]